ncbi:unnamed protein product, partial [Prorocentrum cordatum]
EVPNAPVARPPPGGLSADAPVFSPPTAGVAEIAAGAGRYAASDDMFAGPPVFEFMDEEQFFTP